MGTSSLTISREHKNLAAAVAIAIGSGTLCWTFLHRFRLGAADFNWAWQAAHVLLSGGNPYANTPNGTIPYPLPAAIVALPFAAFPREVAGALFFGLSSGLLAFGLARQSSQRLLIFLAFPYWAALMTAQWTPLIASAAFFPAALAVCVVKPQISVPVAATHWSVGGIISAALLLAVSLVLRPRWPLEWIPQLHGYQHFVPVLLLPGPLILLALWRWRDRDAWLLLLAALMPQRWFYDCFVLWLIPKTRRTILFTVACSWVVGIWRWYHIPNSIAQVGIWSVLGFYIPMLGVVLSRAHVDNAADSSESSTPERDSASARTKPHASKTTGMQSQ